MPKCSIAFALKRYFKYFTFNFVRMEKHTALQAETFLQGGKYRIEKILGQGGFGITYLAYQTTFQDNVVIKEFFLNGFCLRSENNSVHSMNLPTGEFAKFKDRFLQEARFLYKLKGNKNIAEVLDFFEENGTAYMVMPYIADEDVERYARRQPNNRVSEAEAIHFMEQTANALAIVHANHILHRDIKPSNLLRKSDGTIVLIDFGSARELLSGEFSQTMSTIISAGYAPPEQYNVSAKRGPFSDIYSMGGTMYRLLTGKLPLDATMRSIEDILEPITINTSISQHVNDAIMKALQLKPANRYQNVSEFIHDLHTPVQDDAKTEMRYDERQTTIIGDKNISLPKAPQTEVSIPKERLLQAPTPSPISQNTTAWHQKTPIRVGLAVALLSLIGFGTYKAIDKGDDINPNDSTEVALDTDTFSSKENKNGVINKKDSLDEVKRKADLVAKEQHIKDSIKMAAQQMSEGEKLKSFNEAKQKGDMLFAQKQYEAAKRAYQTALQLNPKDAYCKGRIQACDTAIAESNNPPIPEQPNYNPPPRPARTVGVINGLKDATGEIFDYEGDIVSGTPNGNGIFRYKSGSICKGKVVNGHLNGQCECNYADRSRFVGNAVNDVCTGFGTYYFSKGGRYEGNFENDAFNGPGKVYHQNGKEWFEGNFKNGNAVGTVIWHYPDGSTQKGHLEDNSFIPNGGGSKSSKSGDIKTHHKL